MSISKLIVNLQRSFGAGMVYVALSRCTSRDGLQVRRVGYFLVCFCVFFCCLCCAACVVLCANQRRVS